MFRYVYQQCCDARGQSQAVAALLLHLRSQPAHPLAREADEVPVGQLGGVVAVAVAVPVVVGSAAAETVGWATAPQGLLHGGPGAVACCCSSSLNT